MTNEPRFSPLLLGSATAAAQVLVLAVIALVGPTVCSGPARAQGAAARLLVFEEILPESEEHELRWPVAVAAPTDGEIAVADAWGSRLLLFRKSGVSWRVEGVAALPGTPVGLAHDGGRYLVALREGEGLVAVEGPGLLLRKLALPRGAVAGPMAPRREGGVLLFDPAGGRVLGLDGAGKVASEAPVAGRATALAAAAGGGFYTALAEAGVVRRHRADGSVEAVWELPPEGPVPAWPEGLAVTPGGEVLVSDRHTGRVLVIDADGALAGVGSRQGWEPGLLRFPAGIAVTPDGHVVVADEGNGRVQLFRRVGAAP